MSYNQKIKTLRQLKTIISRLKKKSGKAAFTNGCFDILHYGHVKYLEQARSKADILIVAVNSDNSVKRLKGPERPLYKLKERLGVLAGLSSVDYVVSFDQDTPLEIIKYLKPDILIKGADYKVKDIAGSKFLKTYGGSVRRIRYLKGFSVSSLINKIIKRYGR